MADDDRSSEIRPGHAPGLSPGEPAPERSAGAHLPADRIGAEHTVASTRARGATGPPGGPPGPPAAGPGGEAPARLVGGRGFPAPLSVVAAVVAVYAWALGRGFTSEDFLLLRVLGERPPWRDLAAAFTEPWLGITVVGFYRPLGTLALAAERALFGARPAGYLAVHVALHALNAVLVLWLARRMLGGGPAAGSGGAAVRGPARRSTGTGSSGRPVEAGQESPGAVARATAALPPDSPVSPVAGRPSLLRVVPAGSPAALAAALLFALYPLHPNAVVWVASYATLFAAAAVFGCLLGYRRAREQGGWGWWFGALALFAAALGCYEAAVVLPVVLAATDLLAPAVVWGGSRERPERATGAEAGAIFFSF
jgi:hypothetical protein